MPTRQRAEHSGHAAQEEEQRNQGGDVRRWSLRRLRACNASQLRLLCILAKDLDVHVLPPTVPSGEVTAEAEAVPLHTWLDSELALQRKYRAMLRSASQQDDPATESAAVGIRLQVSTRARPCSACT